MNTKLVYIVNCSAQYRALFVRLGFGLAEDVISADLVCFTGGEDVSPELYGDAKHSRTYSNIVRDVEERKVFEIAQVYQIPCVGICRGGQFLNVMSGGRLYQDVSKHALHDGHLITDVLSGSQVWVSSTHHQMFMPGSEAVLVACSTLGGYREWFDGSHAMRDESNTDYEVLWYPKTQCLCFQPHPEFTGEKYEGMYEYFDQLLERFLDV